MELVVFSTTVIVIDMTVTIVIEFYKSYIVKSQIWKKSPLPKLVMFTIRIGNVHN